MGTALTEFIQTMTGGLTDMASAIGSGLNSAVQDMFLEMTDGAVTGLSTFGGVVAIFRTA